MEYIYGDESWGDLLTSYDGTTITYDGIGNPLTYGSMTYTWEHGRELSSLSDGTTTWTYTYDANGMRTSRSNGTTTFSYVYNGSKLTQMTVGNNVLYFIYAINGAPAALKYGSAYYCYVTNLQGDVIAIMSSAGAMVVSYEYDAWGNIVSIGGTMASTLGVLNPLTYRGYVYDHETGLYYLQSRYYNPTWGRFLNADVLVATGQGMLGNNMFAYCRNNPVKRKDATGTEDICVTDGEDDDSPFDDVGVSHGGGGISGGNSSGGTGGSTSGGGAISPNSAVTIPTLPDNPLKEITYTDKVKQDMLKDDFHGFPEIVDNYGAYGEMSQVRGGDGQMYNRLRIPGGYKGHDGYFEYMWDSKGVCNHRCFFSRRN